MPPVPPTRRQAIQLTGTALALLQAGGTSQDLSTDRGANARNARLQMTAVTDIDIAYRATALPGISANRQLVERIITNGSATVTARNPPLLTKRPLMYNETVYRLSVETTGRHTETSYTMTLEPVDGTDVDADSIRFEALPAVDRENLASHGLADGDPLGIAVKVQYTDAERDQSMLVPAPDYDIIEWASGHRGRVTVDDASEVTYTTVTYTAEKIAAAEAYGKQLRERHVLGLSGLPASERQIIRRAIEDVYILEHGVTPSGDFRSLMERFRPHTTTDGGTGAVPGDYLVKYDEQVYWTELGIHPMLVE